MTHKSGLSYCGEVFPQITADEGFQWSFKSGLIVARWRASRLSKVKGVPWWIIYGSLPMVWKRFRALTEPLFGKNGNRSMSNPFSGDSLREPSSRLKSRNSRFSDHRQKALSSHSDIHIGNWIRHRNLTLSPARSLCDATCYNQFSWFILTKGKKKNTFFVYANQAVETSRLNWV